MNTTHLKKAWAIRQDDVLIEGHLASEPGPQVVFKPVDGEVTFMRKEFVFLDERSALVKLADLLEHKVSKNQGKLTETRLRISSLTPEPSAYN